MLKTMRKNVKALKPILWLIVFTFIIAIFAFWGGGGMLGNKNDPNVIAKVGKEKVPTDEYTKNLRQRVDAMKKQYTGISAALIQQLNIPLDTLAQILQRKLLLQVSGKDMGLRVSDREVRDKIIAYPAFQTDGKFIGFENYKRVLEYNHISLEEFENSLRNDILIEKTIGILTAGISVSEKDVWDNYIKNNETAKIDYLVLETDKVQGAALPSEAEIKARYAKDPSSYKVPEKRNGDYVFLKAADAKKNIKVTDSDIEKYYKENRAQFEEPEKVKVSRIWLPYTAETKNSVSTQASDLKAKIEAGSDFAGLARQNSKDSKAPAGGDYGYLDWKSLDKMETEAAARLEQGKSTGPLDTGSGFAILKVTEKTSASLKPLQDVRNNIRGILEDEKARNFVAERVQKLEKAARKGKSLDAAARKEGLTVNPTGLLKKGDPLGDFDSAGAVSEALFALEPKAVSNAIYTASGAGLVQLKSTSAERQATFEEARADIARELSSVVKKRLALANMRTIKYEMKNEWASEATARGLEFRTVETFKREQYLSLIGENPEVDDVIFSIPVGSVSDPIIVEGGCAIFRVQDRKSVDKAEFEKNKQAEFDSFLGQKKNVFLQSYMSMARTDRKIDVNYELFQKLTNDILGRLLNE